MGTTSGTVPRYKVSWRRDGSQHQPFAAFEGDLALSQARELYEKLLADPDVTELHLARLDGDAWELHVPPLRRNDAGEWQPA
jgi:hypothetical protein